MNAFRQNGLKSQVRNVLQSGLEEGSVKVQYITRKCKDQDKLFYF